MSLPPWLVPNQWAPLGGWVSAAKSASEYAYGVNSPPNALNSTSARKITTPTTARRLRRKRRR